jgi:hypothetical protein
VNRYVDLSIGGMVAVGRKEGVVHCRLREQEKQERWLNERCQGVTTGTVDLECLVHLLP